MATAGDISDEDFIDFVEEDYRVDANDSGSDVSVSSVDTADLTDFEQDNDDFSQEAQVPPNFRVDDSWSEDYTHVGKKKCSQVKGATKDFTNASPYDFFCSMIPNSYWYAVASETNLYAKQRMKAKGIPENKMDQEFPPTNSFEIKAYVGILMFMNVSPLPSVNLYWSESLPTYNPWVAQIMPRNRFTQLASYFHLIDSTKAKPKGQKGYDPLYKVRPLILLTQQTFAENYIPSEKITVDEAMIKFKGRCEILQYLPAKPTKWGIKVWAACCAETYYMLNFSVYTGKVNELPDTKEPLGDRVVKHLIKPYLHKFHTIFFDNYFTSVALLLHLFENKTFACGTVRNNRRGLPEEMKSSKCVKKSGDTRRWYKRIGEKTEDDNLEDDEYYHTGNLQAVAWFDRRKVTVLTTANDNKDGEAVRYGPGGVVKARYPKPQAICDYSHGYNGVDKHDQMRSYYGCQLKFRKWWKHVFFFCLDTAAVNAYLLYKTVCHGKPISHLMFQLKIIEGLVNNHKGRKRMGRPILKDQADKRRHLPTKIETARGKRDCTYCKTQGRLTVSNHAIQTVYECKKCAVALCKSRGCFGLFHQEE